MFRPFPYLIPGEVIQKALLPVTSMGPALRIINVVLLVPILHSISTGMWIPAEPPLVSTVLLPSIGVWWFQWLTLRLKITDEPHYTGPGNQADINPARQVSALWFLLEPIVFQGIQGTRATCTVLTNAQRRAVYGLAIASLLGIIGLGGHEYLSNRCRLSLGEGVFDSSSTSVPESEPSGARERLFSIEQLRQMENPLGPLNVVLTDEQIHRVETPGHEIFVPLLLPNQIKQWLVHEQGDTDNERLREFIELPKYGQSRAAILAVTLSADRWRILHSQMWFVIAVGVVMSSVGAAVACARVFLLSSAERRIEMSKKEIRAGEPGNATDAQRARREVVVSVGITLVLVALNMGLYARQAKEVLEVIWLPPHIRGLAIVLATALGMVVFQVFFGVFHIASHVGKAKRQLLILFFALSAATLILLHGMMVAKCVIPLTPGEDSIPVPRSATYSKDSLNPPSESKTESAQIATPTGSLQQTSVARKAIYVPLQWVGKMKERLAKHHSDSPLARAEEVRHDEDWFDESAPNQYPWQYAWTSILFGLVFAGISACMVAVIALTGELFLEAQNPLVNAGLQWLGVQIDGPTEKARRGSDAGEI